VTLPERRPWPRAVLLDRDGTLCIDVPYNGDPERVVPVPGAAAALQRLRDAGLRTAVISNQSGIGRGLHTRTQVDAVNARLDELIGPLGPVLICPHAPDAACRCRKPAPGLVLDAADALGVATADCVLIGDIAADLGAANAAGAASVLVPTEMTRTDEVERARDRRTLAPDLTSAIDLVLSGTLARPAASTDPAGAAA
jgi:histidinol-phosphate phosphatase family protein